MTADLVSFLRARLDEDEQTARAATPGPWRHNPAKQWLDPEAFEQYDRTKGNEFVSYGGPHPFTGCIATTGPADDAQSMADASHIARHDPARVLAEVDAKRELLDTYAHAAKLAPEMPGATAVMYALRPSLRKMAAIYREHPDYRPEWAPDE